MAKPVAVATANGSNGVVDIAYSGIGTAVNLSAVGSFDADGYSVLTYQWQMIDRPVGSSATLSSATVVNPTFTPDKAGSYLFFLTVTSSDPVNNTSELEQRRAPSCAFVEVCITTQNFAWSVPASGSRDWSSRVNPIYFSVDAELGSVDSIFGNHDFIRTDTHTGSFDFSDARTAGGSSTDPLITISNKNTPFTLGQYGAAVVLDIVAGGTGSNIQTAFRQIDGDMFAKLDNQAFGIYMKENAGTQIGFMFGDGSTSITQGVALTSRWSGSYFYLFDALNTDRSVEHRCRLSVETDPDVAQDRVYMTYEPVSGGEEFRVKFDRHRVHLNRNLFIELDPGAPSPYQEDWDIDIFRNGESVHAQFGYREDIKGFIVQPAVSGAAEDAVVVQAGALERSVIERGSVPIPFRGEDLPLLQAATVTLQNNLNNATVFASIRDKTTALESKTTSAMDVYASAVQNTNPTQVNISVRIPSDLSAQLTESTDYIVIDYIVIGGQT